MIFTGRRLSAAEALHHGLASQVTPPDALIDAALELARAIAASAPLAIAAAKNVIRVTRNLDVEAGFAAMRSGAIPSYQRAIQSQDAEEGPRAFAEGRSPDWQGR